MAAPMIVGGCSNPEECTDKACPGEGGDTGSDGPEGEWSVAAIEEAECTSTPSPTRYAHMAAFVVDEPVLVGTRYVNRGIVLHGGMDGGGTATDALWLYDLSTPNRDWADSGTETYECPWIDLGSGGLTEGRYGGGFGWDPNSEKFILAGGVEGTSPTSKWATDAVNTLDLRALGAGFAWVGSLDSSTVSAVVQGDDFCSDAQFFHYGWNTDCDQWVTSADQCTNTFSDPGSEEEAAHDFGCVDDPWCTDGNGELTDSDSAPGRWAAASYLDPVAGKLYMVGGATGCGADATLCAPWEGVASVGYGATPSLNLANLASGVEVSATGSTTPISGVNETSDLLADWPAAATAGLRGAAGGVRVSWSRTSHTFGAPSPAAYGGTWQQDLAPATEHFTGGCTLCDDAPDDFLCDACMHCLEYSSWWEADSCLPDPGGAEAWTAGLVPTSEAWMSLDGSDGYLEPSSSQPGAQSLLDAALVQAPSSGGFLVVGGRSDYDTTGAEVVFYIASDGSYGGSLTLPTNFGGRYGASTAWDPVAQIAYVWGGRIDVTAARMVAIRGPDSLRRNEVAGVAVDAELGSNDPRTMALAISSTYGVNHEMRLPLTANCAADCYIDRATYVVPTVDAGELATLAVTLEIDGLEYPELAVEATGTLDLYPILPGAEATWRTGRLPMHLTASTGLDPTLVVRWTAADSSWKAADGYDEASDGFRQARWTAGAGSAGVEHRSMRHWSAWLGLATHAMAGEDTPQELDQVTVSGIPAGHALLGPGIRSTPSASEVQLDSIRVAPARLMLVLAEGAAKVGEATTGGRTVSFWSDIGAGTAAGADVATWTAAAGADSAQADLDWLVARLGSFPPLDAAMLFTTPGGTTDVEGVSLPGFLVVQAFKSDGTHVEAFNPPHRSFKGTVVHELSHQWIGSAERRVGGDADWTIEAIPTLLAYQRHPHISLNRRMRDGALLLVRQTQRPAPSSPERPAAYSGEARELLSYGAAPYLLMPAQAAASAAGVSESSFWSAWALLFQAQAGALTNSEVEALVDGQVGVVGFYDEWIGALRSGLPLVTIETVSRPTAVADAAAPLGESSASSGVTITVSQVQDDLYGFPLYYTVPWSLVCTTPPAALSPRPFEECNLGDGAYTGTPHILSSGSGTVSLTERTAVTGGYGAFPVRLGVAMREGAFEHAPKLSQAYTTEQLWCALASTHALCAVDGDADGYSSSGDCDDSSAAVHPGPSELAGAGVDGNCDEQSCLGVSPCHPEKFWVFSPRSRWWPQAAPSH